MHNDDGCGMIANPPDQHAFVMLGTKTLFLCHLTMFIMEEHRYQLVMRVSLPDYVYREYLHERKTHPVTTYFLGNSEQDLMSVPELQTGVRTGFIGDVFRGIPDPSPADNPEYPHYKEWPWKGVTPAISHIPVTIERIVYYRHFDFNLNYPNELTYVLFGRGDEAHLTHYQTKEPDFDHVISLAEAPDWLPSQQLEAGVHVNIPGMLGNRASCSNPLTDASYRVQYAGISLEKCDSIIKIGFNHWCTTKVVNSKEKDPCL